MLKNWKFNKIWKKPETRNSIGKLRIENWTG